jgi:4-amino-4-deoxy-L-arabinose transferase-like glycosyltransferase
MNTLLIRYRYPLLALLIYLSFWMGLGTVPLFDLDEGAFSEATREMLLRGDYITTYLNGDLRFDKPILIYWFQALSVKLFGLNEFALRFPSAMAATLWALALYRFARRHYDETTAFTAALFMVASLQITVIAKAAIADALLNLFIALSLFCLYEYLQKGVKRHLYLASAFIALGVLTKGPVAILIPGATLVIFLGLRREWGRLGRILFDPGAWLIFLAIALPWYWLEYQAQGMKFIQGFFLKHNIARFKSSFEGHAGSLLYYIPVILVGMLPFTSVFLKMLGRIRSFWSGDLERYLLIWGLFVFLFFSFSGTKLPHYVIYGYTPFFILMARSLSEIRRPVLLALPLLLLFGVLLFLPEIAAAIAPKVHRVFARTLLESAPQLVGPAYRLCFAASIALLLFLAWSGRLKPLALSFLMGILLLIGVNGLVIPLYGKLAQEPVKEAALLAKKLGVPVVMYKTNTPSFILYSGHLVFKRPPKPGETVFTKISHLPELGHYDILYKKYGYALVKVTP